MKDKAIKEAIERIEVTIRRKLNEFEREQIKLALSILYLDARSECLMEIKEEL